MEYQDNNLNLGYCIASMSKRFANFVIDVIAVNIILLFTVFGVEMIFSGNITELRIGLIEERLLGFILYGLIMFLMETIFQGKSLGKLITGTRVINKDGSNRNIQKTFLRNFIRAVPFNAFSAFGTPCDPWHDKWSGTMVIDEKRLDLQRRKRVFFSELNLPKADN